MTPSTRTPTTRGPSTRTPRALAFALVLGLGAAIAAGPLPAGAQEEPTVVWEDHTLVVTAALPGTLGLTDTPGAPYDGPRLYCAWFSLEVASTTVDIVPVAAPTVGTTYVFNCWYTAPWADPYPGYPIVAVYDPVEDPPGSLITPPEVARFAVDSIDFVPPSIVTAPADTHIVGVESWLAVDSPLDYEPASAQAGPVWATVRPEFRDATWDLGNGDALVCTADATTRWVPDGPTSQSSECAYAYRSSQGTPLVASATISWTVWQRTDRTAGAWVIWGTVSLTTTAEFAVAQLQAVIN